MNKNRYRKIFSKRLGMLVAVSELCRAVSKRSQGLGALGAAVILSSGMTMGLGVAHAQSVPDGSSFSDAGVSTSPADGSVITLDGNASITSTITLPTGAALGSADLTLDAATGGSAITIDATGISGFTNATNNAVTLAITGGDMTFSGLSATVGSVINSTGSGGLTITSTGTLTFDSNTTTAGYGIYSDRPAGPAIYSGGALTLTAPTVILSNNISQSFNDSAYPSYMYTGGAIYSAGQVSITGSLVADNNAIPEHGRGSVIYSRSPSDLSPSGFV